MHGATIKKKQHEYFILLLSPIFIYLIPPNILLKTFLSKAANHIVAISSLSAQDAAPSVATGLINVSKNFVFSALSTD